MRYVVVGAGAVGGTIGARLHESGREVVLVARGEHLTAVRASGLRFVAPDGDRVLDVAVVGGPDEVRLRTDDVLLLAVKSQHTAAALADWSSREVHDAGGSVVGAASELLPLLCVQNGIGNEAAALRWFARVVGVCVWLPASLPQPGTVLAPCGPLSAVLHLGAVPAGRDEPALAAVVADLEAAVVAAPTPPDVMAWKRAKLLSNLGNAFDALFVADSGWRDLLDVAQQEARAVFAAEGAEVVTAEQEAELRGDRCSPVEIAGWPRGGGSTFQSLQRGAGSVETDHLNGEVVARGRALGVPTPINAAVQVLAARALRDGAAPRSLDPAVLRERLG